MTSPSGQLTRLMAKELREILRDRRTILTLVLMPLLLYPLLSVAFRQFFLAGLAGVPGEVPQYRIAFTNEAAAKVAMDIVDRGDKALIQSGAVKARPAQAPPALVTFEAPDLAVAVRDRQVHAAVRLLQDRLPNLRGDVALDFELLYLESWADGVEAAGFLRRRFTAANADFLATRLQRFRPEQRSEPFRLELKPLDTEATGPAVSLAALVPLILILMTITGAVYPAIDLTAGERERGTLEILVAAPVSRFRLLTAKYVAVLTVALLTALVNLVMMTLTLQATGLGSAVFGSQGLAPITVLEVLAILLLFAAFFAAVLLALCSFARSFKEAQAYLIPLMLAALGPGMAGMVPGLKLGGFLTVVPLINSVLLARDLLQGEANPTAAATVVVTTVLYAALALSIAARVFGAEAVLYGNESGWGDLFRRPAEPQPAPTVGAAFGCLALLFPAVFYLTGVLGQQTDLPLMARLGLAACGSAVLFVGLPAVAAQRGHVPFRMAFRLRSAPALAWLGALLLGLGLWPWAQELVLLLRQAGVATLGDEYLTRARELVGAFREIPVPFLLVVLAVVPAVTEELLFRGFLFAALRPRVTPGQTILITGLLFGLFHLVTNEALAVERFAATAAVGLVVSWVAYRSGSVGPGMVLHALHNSSIVLIAVFEAEIKQAGWDVEQAQHLPLTWLAAGAVAALLGAAAVEAGARWRVGATPPPGPLPASGRGSTD